MTRYLFLAFIILCAPAVAAAQDDTPAVEIFGGYSYLRTDADTVLGSNESDMHGWEGSATVNVNRWFGIEANVAGHYGTDTIALPIDFVPGFPGTPSFPAARFDLDESQYTFMGGPKVSYRTERITPFAHALFGGVRRNQTVTTDLDIGFDGTPFTPRALEISDTGFAMAIGGGIDINLTDSVAIRAVQADYLYTRFGEGQAGSSAGQNNVRVSAGIVFRF